MESSSRERPMYDVTIDDDDCIILEEVKPVKNTNHRESPTGRKRAGRVETEHENLVPPKRLRIASDENATEVLSRVKNKFCDKSKGYRQAKHSKGFPKTGTEVFKDQLLSSKLTSWEESFLRAVTRLITMDERNYFSTDFQEDIEDTKWYLEVVKNPAKINFQFVQQKLSKFLYMDPWEAMKDVFLIFDNRKYFNPEDISIRIEYDRLLSHFEQRISKEMKSLGYCCGRLDRRVLYCQMKTLYPCIIDYKETYFIYKEFVICRECFNAILGNKVRHPDKRPFIEKKEFDEVTNERPMYEPFVNCKNCDRRYHQYCVLHDDRIYPKGFICNACLKAKNIAKPCNLYKAKNFKHTSLSKWIEDRVKGFLAAGGGDNIIVRVLSSGVQTVRIDPVTKKKFSQNPHFRKGFPYRSRTIFAFQLIDGEEVCFFAMYVHEYGTDKRCPLANRRCVYLAYIDSVSYFVPAHLRTEVYQEIILGYLDHAKSRGYTSAHIWACPPPTPTSDYIFRFHPPHQKIPDAKRLQDWYKTLITKGKRENIIQEYHNIYAALKDKIKTVADIPYFDGDLIPILLYREIEELDNEKLMNEESEWSESEPGESDEGEQLLSKMLSALERNNKSVFVLRLQSEETAMNQVIEEVDQNRKCHIVESRDDFLNFSEKNNYEFSTLEKAKFSTMCLVYELCQLNPTFLAIRPSVQL